MTAQQDRFLELDGAFNFRDLGGLATNDGGTTRPGLLFRSDALHHLAPAAVDRLVDLGIRTVIDLRSAVELERSGRGPLESTDIGWLHAPLTHGDAAAGNVVPPALAEGDMGRHYVESLPARSEMLAQVITHLADRDNLPAVFHCTAGKDRTGMVAALVLSLVGVPDEVIVHDYTLTDDRMHLVIERIQASNALPQSTTPMAAGVWRAEASSMETFLAAQRTDYGSVEGWARAAGITAATLASLHALLVTDNA